jgi:hypothetical protein
VFTIYSVRSIPSFSNLFNFIFYYTAIMSTCGKCSLAVNRGDKNKLQCSQCRTFFHGNCLKLEDSEIEILLSRPWSCEKCFANERRQRSQSDSTPVKTVHKEKPTCEVIDLSTLVSLFESFKTDILSSQKNLEKKLDESIASFKLLNETISRQQESIELLKKENEFLKTEQLKTLALLDEHEQYSRRNTVEIHGVPENVNEDVLQIVTSLGRALDIDLSSDAIDCAHRLGKPGGGRPSGIAVKFVRRIDADLFLERKKKKKLSPRMINLTGEGQIFVNQSLTRGRRKLFNASRELLKNRLVCHVWCDRAGRVKVRRVDGGNIFIIKSESDLEQFLK